MGWRTWLPLAVFLGFVGLSAYMLLKPKDEEVRSAMVGKELPYFVLPPATADLPGVANADFSGGKPRLLNVWASWCVPCVAEAPQLEMLQAQGAEIYGVAIRDRPEDIAAFLARHGNPYARIGRDDLSEVQLGIGSSGVPETFVINGEGVITYQHIGDIRPEHVPMLLNKLREAQ